MKLYTLIENTAACPALQAEHGLSLYLETDRYRILFDAGQTDAFAENARQMGVDLASVDLAVLSHGHYDHSGGLRKFLAVNAAAPIFVSPQVFGRYYNAADAYIGVDPLLRGESRIRPAEDGQVIGEGLTLYSCTERATPYPVRAYGLQKEERGEKTPDDFRHEQYLLVEEAGRRILISGCSHRGILNLVEWFKPDVLVGGFHFMKLDPSVPEDAAELDRAAEVLLQYPTVYYTGHCTGEAQYAYLSQRMGHRLRALHSGSVVLI